LSISLKDSLVYLLEGSLIFSRGIKNCKKLPPVILMVRLLLLAQLIRFLIASGKIMSQVDARGVVEFIEQDFQRVNILSR
jgi:hypothetical protein